MAHVVRGEMHLVAVGRQTGRLGHDAGVGEEQVETGGFGEDLVGGVPDRCEVRQVACHEGGDDVGRNRLDVLYGLLGGFGIATGEKDAAGIMFR